MACINTQSRLPLFSLCGEVQNLVYMRCTCYTCITEQVFYKEGRTLYIRMLSIPVLLLLFFATGCGEHKGLGNIITDPEDEMFTDVGDEDKSDNSAQEVLTDDTAGNAVINLANRSVNISPIWLERNGNEHSIILKTNFPSRKGHLIIPLRISWWISPEDDAPFEHKIEAVTIPQYASQSSVIYVREYTNTTAHVEILPIDALKEMPRPI